MKEVIKNILKELEKEEQIEILFASEAGSRAWDLHEATSDYDVRFIYKHKKEWYLQLYEGQDVLEKKSFDTIEYVGWDLKKALRLVNKSNPTLLEWIHSPLIYFSNPMFKEDIRTLANKAFSPYSVLHHYFNMAKKNYAQLLQSDEPTAKMYLNVLKPLFSSYWIKEHNEFPTISLNILINSSSSALINKEVKKLILHKRNGLCYTSQVLNHFIESSLETLEVQLKSSRKNKSNCTNQLTEFFIKTIE